MPRPQKWFVEPGQRFGRLRTIRADIDETVGYRRRIWFCICDCGREKYATAFHLYNGNVKSCGCWSNEHQSGIGRRYRTHGEGHGKFGSTEYRIWRGMKTRCYNVNNPAYSDYGGRGIQVCQRWFDRYENFLTDMGRRPSPTHSIDRINVNGHYEPDNCRWATPKQQANNTRPRRPYAGNRPHSKINKEWPAWLLSFGM